MNGPLPSTRVFLSDLPCLPTGSKVRFLGCVRTYDISTGYLVLEHNYSRYRPKQAPPFVLVDVNPVLETVTCEELSVGAWINVLGYVRRATDTPHTATAADNGGREVIGDLDTLQMVSVEAVVIFPAGPIALGEYERILNDLQEVDRTVQRPD